MKTADDKGILIMSDNAGNFASRLVNKKTGSVDDYDLFADPRKTNGQKIMELAEIILPKLREWLTGVRDPEGMLLHPARVRAISIQVSQRMVAAYEQNN